MNTPSPEERAQQVEIVVERVGDPRDPQNYVDHEATTLNIAAAIREAVAAETEPLQVELSRLCSLLADTQRHEWEETGGYYDACRKQYVHEKPA